ncbi:MAG: hypothetical protein GX847_08160 [Clostridiales bacterium]|nr:hypothetical protein [Clostridiales bacterium]
MKSLFYLMWDKFFSKKLDFRVRLFNILAMAGVLISLVSAAVCLLNGEGWFAFLSNLLTTPIAAGLLFYAARTGRYQLCYMITIVVIFLFFSLSSSLSAVVMLALCPHILFLLSCLPSSCWKG